MCKIKTFVIGIQYEKTFALLDNWGKIFDNIIRDDAYFPKDHFPQVSMGQYEHTLCDANGNYLLKLSPESIVYRYFIDSEADELEEIGIAFQRVDKFLAKIVVSAFELSIRRLGFVYGTLLSEDEHRRFCMRYFSQEAITQITAFRFSIKTPSASSMRDKKVTDYTNKIFTVDQENGRFPLTYDYQQYYFPMRPNWIDSKAWDAKDKSFDSFQRDVVNPIKSK